MQTNYSDFSYKKIPFSDVTQKKTEPSSTEKKSELSSKISKAEKSNRNFNINEIDLANSEEEVQKAHSHASTVFHLPKEKNNLLENLKVKVTEMYKKTIANFNEEANNENVNDNQAKPPEKDPVKEFYLARAEKSKAALDEFITNVKKIDTISIPEDPSQQVLRFKESGLKLERYPDGKLYAQLNVFLGKGADKVVKISVNLDTLKPTVARATIKQTAKTPDIENEVKIQSLLEGPEFVKILATCTYEGKDGSVKMGLMMENCDGGSLRQLGETKVGDITPQTQNLYWRFTGTVLNGLKKMDAKNIHHRDLKPENLVIQIDDSGEMQLKIADFGYAITTEEEAKNIRWAGTPPYLPPELFKVEALKAEAEELIKTGTEENIKKGKELIQQAIQLGASTKGDMWAFGLILLELRTAHAGSLLEILNVSNNSEFFEELFKLNQNDIRKWFSGNVNETGPIKTIEDLNYRMLQIDPAKRISTEEALLAFQELEKNDHNFCISQSELDNWADFLYPES